MFCLCNPASTASPFLPGGQQGWCHAHSPDMMTQWTIEQPALPGPHAPGTGNIILLANANGSAFPATTYGGVAFTSGGLAALSGSKDILLVNWTMSSAQPLIPAPPPTKTNVTLLGDVSVAGRVNSGGNHVWTMVVGSSSAPVNGTTGPVALFYESMDLKNWCGHRRSPPDHFSLHALFTSIRTCSLA